MTNATNVARHGPGMSAAAAVPTRRVFLAQAASSAILAASVTPAFSRDADPILATIEAHKAAIVARDFVIDRHSALDRELPVEKCRSTVTLWEEIIVETDDPRWIECERALAAANDAETDAAIALVSVLPTSRAGLLALLQYAVTATEADREVWPELLPDENSKWPRPWHHFLIANLVEILPSMMIA